MFQPMIKAHNKSIILISLGDGVAYSLSECACGRFESNLVKRPWDTPLVAVFFILENNGRDRNVIRGFFY